MSTTHTHHPTLSFRSRVDWWLAIILLVTPLLLIAATVGAFFSGDTLAVLIMLITSVGVIALLLGVAWPLAYVLEDHALVVRAGRLRTRVPYSAITSVRPSRNPLASPAMSLQRLRIDHGNGQFVLISPDDRVGFVRALHARAPQATLAPDLQPVGDPADTPAER